MRALVAATAIILATPAAAQTDAHERWNVTSERTPLTGSRFMSAGIESSNRLLNMLGYQARASLTLRCSEGALAVYVNWPQVVSHDGENFFGQTKTMVIWRIDDQKLKSNLWDIDTTGTAAGEFKSRSAQKLLASFAGAKKLVVRMAGQQVQDAEFDLGGFDVVAPEIASACGMKLQG
ncbi:hypothetical protein FIM10_09630 [Sphingomonadales bacterium 56]|nr:hypothetical protein [Sphingomonadales bacterium 56]CAD7338274.1 hypothetical protein SPHS6_01947 [Sphingobium sp. S6]CAD7338695.1 hypothetical protein SPHS8_02165 [Sphingobium sp. S8]